MCVNVIDYREGDIQALDLREGDAMGMIVSDPPGPAWTAVVDGDPIACGAIVCVGGGVGTLSLYVTDKARGHGFGLAKHCKRIIDAAMSDMRYWRIQTVIRTDRTEYVRYAKLFGFELEGLMRKASPHQDDLYLFARVN